MHIHVTVAELHAYSSKRQPEEIATMSRQIINSFGRSLAVASAALLIHLGSAAAATPQSDFQSQVSAVLAGNIAGHSSPRTDSARDDATGSKVDAQESVRQLLLGRSASHPGLARRATQSQSLTASDVGDDSAAQEDAQTSVQRFLRGSR
jgi:hypothetical protein